MNISRDEQRALHVLARGGLIRHERGAGGKVLAVTCFTHDGLVLESCDLQLFARLRKRGLIQSRGGAPYRISLKGRRAVRAQPDNAA
ncbi:YjhX family toxin [Vannielia litorea]|uniref:YjhX family toxin n=1 Tax=Vannielia TaxID=2813041 RepID=UPI001C97D3D2|nr:YjhX family toxin [Vannielia litorea]MBY6048068.1 YjhX family toxin [Vannielia litorea]MBY6075482.1 YjhX family toxin [Vannielia litorea]MBY6152032.1 YjhX family toxin [Vannielia litorea]